MSPSRLVLVASLLSCLTTFGCTSSHDRCEGPCPDAGAVDAARATDGGDVSCLPHAPAAHRSAATECDHERRPGTSPEPGGGPPATCTTDADCTDGINGRCNGNGHDGWNCTYDRCFADDECSGGGVCECEGGFRSDANVCLPGDCRTDADCATGFCSPTLGSCGDYTGTVGWFCHTCEDECVDDSDCAGDGGIFGAPYCAFDPALGHWACANSHCVG